VLDFYPYSRYLRFGLSSEYAREHSSRLDKDWYLAEHVTLGVQRPAIWTPFVEGAVGGGYLKRTVVSQEQPTALWDFGVSAGVLYHFAPPAFVSAALGWIHPVWLLVNPSVTRGDTSDLVRQVYTDALTVKLSLGF